MWFLKAPAPVLGLTALTLISTVSAKPYPIHIEEFRELHNATQLQERSACGGVTCGYYGQLCCAASQGCFTDANNQAQCGGPVTAAATGGWVYYTSTWVETGLVTRTSVYSSYVGATAQATATSTCSGSQSPCGSTCCDSGYYCLTSGQCALIGGGSSGGVYTTGKPTATVPFTTPIATGVNATVTSSQQSGGGGLSGGAIAGIVIGVIAGILLLLLLCLFCCARAIFDSILAIFGLGRKRRHTHEETYIEEHHHSSGAGGGRRWYGQGPARPPRKQSGGGFGQAAGIGALLGGLAIALGLKRRHDRRHDEKTSSSYSYSDYSSDYTSSSSASSGDRRTHHTRHSSSRR